MSREFCRDVPDPSFRGVQKVCAKTVRVHFPFPKFLKKHSENGGAQENLSCPRALKDRKNRFSLDRLKKTIPTRTKKGILA